MLVQWGEDDETVLITSGTLQVERKRKRRREVGEGGKTRKAVTQPGTDPTKARIPGSTLLTATTVPRLLLRLLYRPFAHEVWETAPWTLNPYILAPQTQPNPSNPMKRTIIIYYYHHPPPLDGPAGVPDSPIGAFHRPAFLGY